MKFVHPKRATRTIVLIAPRTQTSASSSLNNKTLVFRRFFYYSSSMTVCACVRVCMYAVWPIVSYKILVSEKLIQNSHSDHILFREFQKSNCQETMTCMCMRACMCMYAWKWWKLVEWQAMGTFNVSELAPKFANRNLLWFLIVCQFLPLI